MSLPSIIFRDLASSVVVTLTGVTISPDPGFTGIAYVQPEGREPSSLLWVAYPAPNGYRVFLTTHLHGAPISGAVAWHGPTLNLGLEVAAACANWVGISL